MASRRQKVKDLIELALDEGSSEHERLSAAMRAVKIIDKYDMLSSPLDALLEADNETVRAGASIVQALTNPTLVQNIKKVSSRLRRSR